MLSAHAGFLLRASYLSVCFCPGCLSYLKRGRLLCQCARPGSTLGLLFLCFLTCLTCLLLWSFWGLKIKRMVPLFRCAEGLLS